MGLLGSLFGSDPEYNAPQQNAQANAAIDFVRQSADRTPDQIHANNMKGVGGQEYMASEHDKNSADASLGMGNDEAARQALSARAARHYSSAYNDIENQSKINSVDQAIHSKNQYDHLALRMKAINSAVAHHKSMAELQTSAARNKVLGDVLGAAGYVGGFGAAKGWFGGGAPSSVPGAEDAMAKGHMGESEFNLMKGHGG